MIKIIVIAIILIGCLSACWAIFHVKKKKQKNKKEFVKETKKEDASDDKKEIKEDIKLTKNNKLKIVKSAVLQPKVERVYAKQEQPLEMKEEPVVVVRSTSVKPKKIATGQNAKRTIEKVFDPDKKNVEEETEPVKPVHHEPVRTPSIADRIEFREHLAEIYGGFGTGVNTSGNKASEIDNIQSKVAEEEQDSKTLSDYRRSSLFAAMMGEQEEPVKKQNKLKKLSAKDMILAETILNRPKLSKNLKNFNKK